MSQTDPSQTEPAHSDAARRSSGMYRLRNYFLTGLVIAAPLFLTVYITWTFVEWIDNLVEPFIPRIYRLNRYLPVAIPGFGLAVALVFITLLGFMTANLVGRRMVHFGESLLGRMPLVRNLYGGLKQIFETVVSRRANAFRKVALIEYPRKGIWSVVFVAAEARGEVDHQLSGSDDAAVAVFLPTTPNPTSGFLLYVKRSDLTILDMSVEEAAKLVISGGLVTPPFEAKPVADADGPVAGPPRKVKRFNPPSAA